MYSKHTHDSLGIAFKRVPQVYLHPTAAYIIHRVRYLNVRQVGYRYVTNYTG